MNKPISGDSSLLKSMNKSTLLGLIRTEGPISRAEMSKRTKLTRATVSTLVEELIEAHLVLETGIGQSNGGRKPMLLELNPSGGWAIGLDLRLPNMLLLVTDMRGGIVRKRIVDYEAPLSAEADPSRLLEQIVNVIQREAGSLPPAPLGLLGVGIGVPGFVQYPSSDILFIPHTRWRQLAWREALEARLGVPVMLDNEANLAAVGEWEYGAGAEAGSSDMLYISVAGGIGAGFILNGELFRGIRGFAGEIGHTTIAMNGRRCPCGNLGCWEMYASERALAAELGVGYTHETTGVLLGRLAKRDAAVEAALAQIGEYLGIGVGNMMHTLNPQLIVIGGAISEYRSWLHESLAHSLGSRFSYLHSFQAQLDYSRLGEDACALGAASSVIRARMRLL